MAELVACLPTVLKVEGLNSGVAYKHTNFFHFSLSFIILQTFDKWFIITAEKLYVFHMGLMPQGNHRSTQNV